MYAIESNNLENMGKITNSGTDNSFLELSISDFSTNFACGSLTGDANTL